MIVKRKLKLILFFLTFLIVAPLVVLYATGNIFSGGWSILPTGGIYMTGAPVGASVFLNGSLKDIVRLFDRDFLIKNLRSGTYLISVQKLDDNSWTQRIAVSDNLVAEVRVFMLPEHITDAPIAKYATSTISTIPKINPQYIAVSALFASPLNALGTVDSPVMNDKLGLWQQDGKIFVGWFGDQDSIPDYFCTASSCADTLAVYNINSTATRIGFLPDFDDAVIIAAGNKIYAVQTENYANKIPQVMYQGMHPDFRIDDGNLYVKDNGVLSRILL